MTKAKTPKAPVDPLERELKLLPFLSPPYVTPARDPAGATDRLRAGWADRAPSFVRGLAHATDAGRVAFDRAQAFVDEGMPEGVRDPDEQAAFFTIAAHTSIADAPAWQDFLDRWTRAGGLAYAIAIALRLPRPRTIDDAIALVPGECDTYPYGLIAALRPQIDALDAAERAALRDALRPAIDAAPAQALGGLAVVLDDGALALEACARDEGTLPVEILGVLRDGETFARVLARHGESMQVYGSTFVHEARARLSDAARADAIVRFFVAGLAEPRRYRDASASKFAIVACTIADPRLAWLFADHGKHAWLKKHAAMYAERHPDVRPEAPGAETLAARLAPPPPPIDPPGFTKAELDALDPDVREARLIERASTDRAGAVLALRKLADYPTPRLAVAIHAMVHDPAFATQMPKPGFHSEKQADLAAIAKKHPAMARAIADAKKKER